MKSLCAKIVAPGKFKFVYEQLPELKANDILVKMDSVGLCHSDLPRFNGKATIAVSPEGYRESRPVEFPCMVGHEPVGTVIEVGAAVTRFKVGDKISGHMPTCFRTHLVISENSLVFKLPDDLRTDHRLCVAEPLGCIVNLLNVTMECNPGKTAIVGCGHLGLLTISGLRSMGVDNITAVDLDDGRLALATEYGACTTINPKNEDVRKAAWKLTEGHFYDTVIEITGSIKGLETACKIIKFAHVNGMQNEVYHGCGRILSSSVFSAEETFPFGLAHDMMLRTPIIYAVHPNSGVNVLENDIRGVEMYNEGTLPLDRMISHICKFEDLAEGFSWLTDPPADYVKGIVVFE